MTLIFQQFRLKHGAHQFPGTAGDFDFHKHIFGIFAETHPEIRNGRIEFLLRPERRFHAAPAGVPEAETTAVNIARIAPGDKCRGVLIAVTIIVPVASMLIEKGDAAAVILIGSLRIAVKRMNVAQAVAAGFQFHTGLHLADAHISKGVVQTLHPESDRIRRAGAVDIDLLNIGIGGAVVGTLFDMDADFGVFDGGVADHSFSAAVDGNAVGNAAAIHDPAGKGVIAAGNTDAVVGMGSAQPHHCLRRIPGFRSFQNGEVREFQRNAPAGIGGGQNRFGEHISPVRKIDGAIGIFVDDLLNGIGYIAFAVIFEKIRHRQICGSGAPEPSGEYSKEQKTLFHR